VIGDSMADWLGYGLDETYADQPDIGVERKVRAVSGLIRYDWKNETLDWPGTVKDALASERPSAIVVMLGLNDRIAIRDKVPAPTHPGTQKSAEQPAAQATQKPPQAAPAASSDSEAAPQDSAAADTPHPAPGGSYEFHTDPWAAQYSKRVDEMIAALKSKGVPVLWVGLPAIRGTKSTTDMAYLDEIYRERAEKAGIIYVDIWDGFVDDQGRYVVMGPDFEGQTRPLRTGDGVHFTKAGAVKLASFVDLELRRVMTNHVLPVALPGSEEKPTTKPGAPRPDVGPILPLTTSSSDTGGLLGAGGNPAPIPDPVAAKVLSRGDPIVPPAGRADDFSWPRPVNDANVTPVAVTPEPSPLAPGKKGAAAGNKPADVKKDAKTKPTADLGAGKSAKPPAGGF
jgi:lysophospholipase L1-like esterase